MIDVKETAVEVEDLVKKYLKEGQLMQVATSADEQPWICMVYFAADNNQNLYWISTPARRHSNEIRNNSKVAASIPIKFAYGESIIGLQVEGEAAEINDAKEIASGIRFYTAKYALGEQFYNDFLAGKNKHKLYKMRPTRFALFDTLNFPGLDQAKEWLVG